MTAMPAGSAVAWAPEDLPVAPADLASWDYVVVEEIIDDVALLRRWSWPVVDPLGRLLWPDGAERDCDDVTVEVGLLSSQLYAPNGITRQPRCGDAFAAPRSAGTRWPSGHVHDLRTLFGDAELYDISADAREAAKIAHQASSGAIRAARAAEQESVSAVRHVLQRRAEQHLPPLRLSVLPEPPRRGRPR